MTSTTDEGTYVGELMDEVEASSERERDKAAAKKPHEERSLVRVMASRYELNETNFITAVKKACFTGKAENPTNEELMIFLGVAERYGLDPFVKEITAFRTKQGGIANVVTIDGWVKLIQKQPMMDGLEFKDDYGDGDSAGRSALISITCQIFRKDQSHPTECTEYMIECKKKGDGYTPWNQWPRRMLRHKALIQCARYAFGFSGIIDPDEALRMAPVAQASGDGGEAGKAASEAGSADDLTSPRLADDQSNPHEKPTEGELAQGRAATRPGIDVTGVPDDYQGGGEQDSSAAREKPTGHWLPVDHGALPQSEGYPDDYPSRDMRQTSPGAAESPQTQNEAEATDEKPETKTERTNRLRLLIEEATEDHIGFQLGNQMLSEIKMRILQRPSEFTENQYKKLMAAVEAAERAVKDKITAKEPGPAAPSYEDQIAGVTTVETLGEVLSEIMASGTVGPLADDFGRYKELIKAAEDRKAELMKYGRES